VSQVGGFRGRKRRLSAPGTEEELADTEADGLGAAVEDPCAMFSCLWLALRVPCQRGIRDVKHLLAVYQRAAAGETGWLAFPRLAAACVMQVIEDDTAWMALPEVGSVLHACRALLALKAPQGRSVCVLTHLLQHFADEVLLALRAPSGTDLHTEACGMLWKVFCCGADAPHDAIPADVTGKCALAALTAMKRKPSPDLELWQVAIRCQADPFLLVAVTAPLFVAGPRTVPVRVPHYIYCYLSEAETVAKSMSVAGTLKSTRALDLIHVLADLDRYPVAAEWLVAAFNLFRWTRTWLAGVVLGRTRKTTYTAADRLADVVLSKSGSWPASKTMLVLERFLRACGPDFAPQPAWTKWVRNRVHDALVSQLEPAGLSCVFLGKRVAKIAAAMAALTPHTDGWLCCREISDRLALGLLRRAFTTEPTDAQTLCYFTAAHARAVMAAALGRAGLLQLLSRVTCAVDASTLVGHECCSVCMCSIDNEPATSLRCSHVLHAQCAADLIASPALPSCPVCRKPVFDDCFQDDVFAKAALALAC
jgi:hypothetical protein